MAEKFVRGNERLDRLLADPEIGERVKVIHAEMDTADEKYRLGLSVIRRAADLTQVELAERMGLKQAAISGLESREDMLLSTLAKYLLAAGATGARIVVEMQDGKDIELPLPS